jgi:hypothetical protein
MNLKDERLYRIKIFSAPIDQPDRSVPRALDTLERLVNAWIQSNYARIKIEQIWGGRSPADFVMIAYTVNVHDRDRVE